MYHSEDPRNVLARGQAGDTPAGPVADMEYIRFGELAPDVDAAGRHWWGRGQNFLVGYTLAEPGAVFARDDSPDEYFILLPDAGVRAIISSADETVEVTGGSVAIVPPGASRVEMPDGGRVIRVHSSLSEDLAAQCRNAPSYAVPHPNLPPYQPWAPPPAGYRIRPYPLDMKHTTGRHGRIWRSSNLLVYFSPDRKGPRDTRRMSPHLHADFEQCMINIDEDVVHHIRWPWTTDLAQWRDDQHALCRAPAMVVIPPGATHTTQHIGEGANTEIVIYCPPRLDYCLQPGWVLNEGDYPMPEPAPEPAPEAVTGA